MDEIDRMDMPSFLFLRAWALKREKKAATPKHKYIDEIWPKSI